MFHGVKVQLLAPFGRGLNIEPLLDFGLIEALVRQYGRHHFHSPLVSKTKVGVILGNGR